MWPNLQYTWDLITFTEVILNRKLYFFAQCLIWFYFILLVRDLFFIEIQRWHIAQKMKFSIKDFFSKCEQIQSKLRIWSHLQKKSLMENFIFCAVTILKVIAIVKCFPTTEKWWHTWRRSMEKCLIMFHFYSLNSLWPYNWEIFAFKRHWNTLIFCDQRSAS